MVGCQIRYVYQLVAGALHDIDLDGKRNISTVF